MNKWEVDLLYARRILQDFSIPVFLKEGNPEDSHIAPDSTARITNLYSGIKNRLNTLYISLDSSLHSSITFSYQRPLQWMTSAVMSACRILQASRCECSSKQGLLQSIIKNVVAVPWRRLEGGFNRGDGCFSVRQHMQWSVLHAGYHIMDGE